MLVNVKEFNVAIKNATNNLSKDKNRPVFNYIHIFTEDNKLIIEGCDGFTLGKSELEIIEDKTELEIFIKDVKPIKTKNVNVDLIHDPKNHLFYVGSDVYKLDPEMQKSQFINTKEVIPNNNFYATSNLEDNYIVVNAQYLIRALKDITNEIDTKKHTLVKMYLGTDISPIKLVSGNQTNLVLPCRKQ